MRTALVRAMPHQRSAAEDWGINMPYLDTGHHRARLQRCQVDRGVTGALIGNGYHLIAARVLAARCGAEAADLAAPALASLTPPDGLPDINAAAGRLARAIAEGETVGLVTDHDVDGVTSHAVLIATFNRWFGVPHARLRSYIGHRLHDGYGLSEPVVDRILADTPAPNVVITADCGSSDEPRIARLAAAGVDVIVTDHHELGFSENAAGELVEMPPPSALAVVNPARLDSGYGDRLICGAMVTWLTLCATRARLIEAGAIPAATPSLAGLLDFVALGTVADCVSLGASINNRAVVRRGLALIERTQRPCWRAARVFTGKERRLGAHDLAFGIGPRINARGRLSEAMAGVRFLLAESDVEAARLARELEVENRERKVIERGLTEVAMLEAEMARERGEQGLAIWLAGGHPGVHGIVASRVLERFGCPVVCLSPHASDPELITGSARSPAGVHIRDAMERIHRRHPSLLAKFGGHAAAGGLSIAACDLERFQAAFVAETAALDGSALGPVISTDGEIDAARIDHELIEALADLEPYGQGFAAPLFEADLRVTKVRLVGANKSHAQLMLTDGRRGLKGIWFFAAESESGPPLRAGDTARLAFTPQLNEWNGKLEVQLLVRGVVRDDSGSVR
ncbi:MAG: DHH family phosphoesterase [Nitrococcus mobilis]|nr:DHH family phosphoesterase [Nitrococcus mobilis]